MASTPENKSVSSASRTPPGPALHALQPLPLSVGVLDATIRRSYASRSAGTNWLPIAPRAPVRRTRFAEVFMALEPTGLVREGWSTARILAWPTCRFCKPPCTNGDRVHPATPYSPEQIAAEAQAAVAAGAQSVHLHPYGPRRPADLGPLRCAPRRFEKAGTVRHVRERRSR